MSFKLKDAKYSVIYFKSRLRRFVIDSPSLIILKSRMEYDFPLKVIFSYRQELNLRALPMLRQDKLTASVSMFYEMGTGI